MLIMCEYFFLKKKNKNKKERKEREGVLPRKTICCINLKKDKVYYQLVKSSLFKIILQ